AVWITTALPWPTSKAVNRHSPSASRSLPQNKNGRINSQSNSLAGSVPGLSAPTTPIRAKTKLHAGAAATGILAIGKAHSQMVGTISNSIKPWLSHATHADTGSNTANKLVAANNKDNGVT